jgi:exopolysaccharide biosynthesis polyprenyl glycosylphosphotransferase
LEGYDNTLGLHINALVIGILIFLIFSKLLALYRTDTAFDWRRATLRSVTALAATLSVLMIVAAATKMTGTYSRIWFFTWMVSAAAALVLIRTIGLMLVNACLVRGACLQSALIISCGTPALSAKELASETDNRVRASGHLTLPNPRASLDFAELIRDHDPNIIVVDVPWAEVEAASEILSRLSRYAVEVLLLPQKASPSLQIIGSQRLGRQVFLQTSRNPIGHWSRVYKRAEDLFIAIAALLILSPVIFRQKRSGFNGQLIEVWKFRSMYVEETDYDATHQTERNDPRVTRFGRLIRRTSLDELPQLYNVLMGQMSVVGPRPHALQTSVAGKALDQIAEEYALRHRVKPGITGWAQINGSRGELTTVDQLQQRLAYDLYYIENWSLLLDLKIIIKTLATITCDRNAY